MTETLTNTATETTATTEHARNVRTYVPNVDIVECENEIVVLADVPGATADHIHVDYENGVLEFRAEVQPRQQATQTRYLLREYAVGDYARSFRLGKAIDPAGIRAELKDGVLTLHLPKAEPAKRRTIQVTAG
jgi:HSP20 family protein